MRFFKPLSKEDRSFAADLPNDSIHAETIDPAGQAALSTALASYVQATAAISAAPFDARSLVSSDPVHAVAPAVTLTPESGRFAHGVLAPFARTLAVESVHASDASAAAVAGSADASSSAKAASSSDAGPSGEIAAAHAVDATTVATVVADTGGTPTASVVTAEPTAHAAGDAVAIEAIAPVAAVTRDVVSHDPVAAIDGSVDLAPGHATRQTTTPVVESAGAASADVAETGGCSTQGIVAVHGDELQQLQESHTVTLPVWIDSDDGFASVVPDLVTDPAPTFVDRINVAPEDGVRQIDDLHAPSVPIVLTKFPVTDGLPFFKSGTVTPEAALVPQPLDGADLWDNHGMFSVNPPGDGKAPDTTAEVVTDVTDVTNEAQEPIDTITIPIGQVDPMYLWSHQDWVAYSIDGWICNQPVEPEYLRNAPRPEVTLPFLSIEGTGAVDVPQTQTALTLDATTYEAIAATPVLVGVEHDAVL